MIAILFMVWYVLGVSGFIYWWTDTQDLTADIEVFLLILVGFMGPISWVFGWFIQTKPTKIILIKKRIK